MRNVIDLKDYEQNQRYYNGDTFGFWIGPKVDPTQPTAQEVNQAVERIFQSANKVKEVVDRHRRALIGKTPAWIISDGTDSRDGVVAEAELELQQILNYFNQLVIGHENGVNNPLVEAVSSMLLHGKGYLRLWSPARYRNSPNKIKRIALHSPSVDAVEVTRDSDGFIEEIKYRYQYSEQETRVEVQYVDLVTEETVFVTTNEAGEVIEDENGATEIRLDLGGRYSIYELSRKDSLVSESVKRSQNAINFALTMIPRNLEYAGFLRELITNAQPPGDWVQDPNSNQLTFVPAKESWLTGAGITTLIQGIPLSDATGNITGYSNPQVTHHEPVSVQTFIDTLRTHITTIYEEVGQAHLLASESQISGISRVQLRQDFETALQEDGMVVEQAISSVYGASLMMVNQDSIEPYRNLSVVATCRLSVSKPMTDEQTALLNFYTAGLLSQSTTMSQSGIIDDTDAEVALIKEEKGTLGEVAANLPLYAELLHNQVITADELAQAIKENRPVQDFIDIQARLNERAALQQFPEGKTTGGGGGTDNSRI